VGKKEFPATVPGVVVAPPTVALPDGWRVPKKVLPCTTERPLSVVGARAFPSPGEVPPTVSLPLTARPGWGENPAAGWGSIRAARRCGHHTHRVALDHVAAALIDDRRVGTSLAAQSPVCGKDVARCRTRGGCRPADLVLRTREVYPDLCGELRRRDRVRPERVWIRGRPSRCWCRSVTDTAP
jgi:hypothetical protein